MSVYLLKKLGKGEPRPDERTLPLRKYLRLSKLPPLNAAQDWPLPNPPLPMFGNDRAGDCVLAAIANAIALWTAQATGTAVYVPDAQVLSEYSALTGYNPATGARDTGLVVLDVLNAWRQVGLFGHQIEAFLSIHPRDHQLVQYGVQLFGGALAGAALPRAAEDQFDAGQPWLAPTRPWGSFAPGSWGGHAVWLSKFDQARMYARTWTRLQPLSYHWWDCYADECYVPVTKDWLNAAGYSPAGFDLPTLLADLRAL